MEIDVGMCDVYARYSDSSRDFSNAFEPGSVPREDLDYLLCGIIEKLIDLQKRLDKLQGV